MSSDQIRLGLQSISIFTIVLPDDHSYSFNTVCYCSSLLCSVSHQLICNLQYIIYTLLLISLTYRNVIITPSSYHVGTVEQISFTSYNQSQLTVSAILSYRRCFCKPTRFGFTSQTCDYSSDGVKYDIDTATVDQGMK